MEYCNLIEDFCCTLPSGVSRLGDSAWKTKPKDATQADIFGEGKNGSNW